MLEVNWDVMSFAGGGLTDSVLFSQILQKYLEMPQAPEGEFEKGVISRLRLGSHRRPRIELADGGCGVIPTCELNFDKSHLGLLRYNNELSNVVKADIEDIVPVNGPPKATMTRYNRYDGACLKIHGIASTQPSVSGWLLN